VQSGRNTADEGDDGRMTQWGRVEDLPQAEGCETPKAGRPKQGTKTPKNNQKMKGKPKKTKKPKKVAKGNLVGARSSGKSLDPKGGETVVQGGGRGKGNGKGKEGVPGLRHQVNN
jgi:hypothetical protein